MKSSGLKRLIIVLVSLFVIAAVLFVGVFIAQGIVLDRWLERLQKSNVVGAKVENVVTTESSLNMRRVKFDLVWPNPQVPKLSIEGRVLLGFEPQALVWIDAVNGKRNSVINDIHPQANIDLSFLMEPRKLKFTTAAAEVSVPEGKLNLGAIQADFMPGKISEVNGNVRLDDWKVTGSINPTVIEERGGHALKIGTQTFETVFNRNAKERLLYKSSTGYVARTERKIEFISLKNLGFSTVIRHDNGQITQETDLTLQSGNLLGIPFVGTIGKSNVGFSLSWPYDASPYGFLADLFTDSEFCRVFGPLCQDPEGLLGKLNTTREELRKAAMDGKLVFNLQNSLLTFGECKLTSNGMLGAQTGTNEIGHFKVGFESTDRSILRLVEGQLQKGTYAKPTENSIQMNIIISYADNKLIVTSEGRKIFEEHVSPPI